MAESAADLPPRWLNLARAAWLAMFAAAALALIASTRIAWAEPLPACTPQGATCGPWQVSLEDISLAFQMGWPSFFMHFLYLASSVLSKIFFIAVGLLIFWRRSQNWVALLLSLMLVLYAVEGVYNLGSWMPLVNALYAVANIIFYLLVFIFPTGRIEPRWTRWLIPPLALFGTALQFVPQLGISMSDQLYALALMGVFAIWFFLGGYSVLYRYRRIYGMIEKQQTKWVMAGILGNFVLVIPFTIVATRYPPSQPSPERLVFVFLVVLPITVIAYLFTPGSIAIAILRYRLYDIDLIIRRTVQYTMLTALLGLVYFGSVTTLQAIFTSLGGPQSTAATVISTLAIAALFGPLRKRLQEVIDRRFYRRKYDTELMIEKFAAASRNNTNLPMIVSELVWIINEAMQPEHVRLWLTKKDAQAEFVSVDLPKENL